MDTISEQEITTMSSNYTKNLSTGIQIRYYSNGNSSIRILFSYKKIKCRETLKNLTATKANIKHAERLRSEILIEIGKGTFRYSNYFPDSKKSRLFGEQPKIILLKDLLTDYINLAEKTTEYSTYTSYKRNIEYHLIPSLGHITINKLTTKHIRDMIKDMKKYDKSKQCYTTLKAKTIRNILTPLSNIIKEAITDDLIQRNPLDGIFLNKLLPKDSFKSDYIIDPFDQTEVQTIINTLDQPSSNMVQFWFFTGLRPSELMGLEWRDIDFKKGTMMIDRAIVLKRLKAPKTESGRREVMLLPPALKALQQQKFHTFLMGGRVFLHPSLNIPWNHDRQLREWWSYTLKRIGVRYRNPYQCRHTFASTMLSNGENMLWVANQLGHVDTEMVIKVYGKWISDSSVSTGYQCKNDWGKFVSENRIAN